MNHQIDDGRPRWMGWGGPILGIAVIGGGVIRLFAERSSTLNLIFVLGLLFSTLWFLAEGVWIARRAW